MLLSTDSSTAQRPPPSSPLVVSSVAEWPSRAEFMGGSRRASEKPSPASNTPTGQYRVTVFTNGIPSFQKVVDIERLRPPDVPLASVVSRKAHGNIAVFDIPLPATGPPGIECRSGGADEDHTIIFTFATALSSVEQLVFQGASGR